MLYFCLETNNIKSNTLLTQDFCVSNFFFFCFSFNILFLLLCYLCSFLILKDCFNSTSTLNKQIMWTIHISIFEIFWKKARYHVLMLLKLNKSLKSAKLTITFVKKSKRKERCVTEWPIFKRALSAGERTVIVRYIYEVYIFLMGYLTE